MRQKGGALLAVLWLSAALSAIAFSVATTVRGETERTSTLADSVRTYYLATGAINRALLYIEWGPIARSTGGNQKYFENGTPMLPFSFPTGDAVVEIIPETAKLNINYAKPEELLLLLVAMGVEAPRAQEIAMAIVDWRTPAPPGGVSILDAHYLSLLPSFRARHASFQEIDELLLVKGMTPDLFYGTFMRDPQGRLLPQAGLKDCVSVYGSISAVDANYATPAVLTAIGLNPAAVQALAQRRHASPFRNREELSPFMQAAGPAGARLTLGGNTIYTLRSTARLRLPDGRFSDLRRTVSVLLKFNPPQSGGPFVDVLRWYDN